MSLAQKANGKYLQSEKFQLIFFTPLGSIVNIKINFFLQVTSGKFSADVVDTGGKFFVSVIDIPVLHLDLQKSPRIKKKIRNYPTVILKMIHEINLKQKIQ